MIDKEKLLKEIEKDSRRSYYDIIKNFPEEPETEIDFDRLWNGFRNYCDNSGCVGCVYLKNDDKYQCFKEFLKSKNITQPYVDMDQLRNEVYTDLVKMYGHPHAAPKPFEIPVKRTGILKSPNDVLSGVTWMEFKGFKKALVDDNPDIGKRTELEFPDICYTDIIEEPDYSAITKGSIVELKCDDGAHVYRNVSHVDSERIHCFYEDYKTTCPWNKSKLIRVVELAKEGA